MCRIRSEARGADVQRADAGESRGAPVHWCAREFSPRGRGRFEFPLFTSSESALNVCFGRRRRGRASSSPPLLRVVLECWGVSGCLGTLGSESHWIRVGIRVDWCGDFEVIKVFP